MSTKCDDLAIHAQWNRCFYWLPMHPQRISGTSGKNHFYEMNGDVGMAGWQ